MRGNLIICLTFSVLTACSEPQPEMVTRPADSRYIEHGRIFVNGLAACGYCHGESTTPYSPLAGGRTQYDRYGAVKAANLTPSKNGIGEWTTLEIFQAIRASRNREGDRLSSEVHRGYEWMSDEDLLSVVAYLKDLPAKDNEVERRSISLIDRNTTGFLEPERELRGYVPAISPRHQLEYGRYLLENVARCQYCHNAPGTLLTNGAYLAGGQTIKNENGEKVAPGITNSEIYGIGAWSVEAIVQYLMTGKTPDNRFVDPNFCPVGFYRLADATDLVALAKYLKTVSGN